MVEVGEEVMDSGHILFGVGIVENAYDEPATIEAIPTREIPRRERELLREYMGMMPVLPIFDIDILYVDALGKNFSGTGMDTNVIGRFKILGVEEPESPDVKYLIVGDVSEASHGNALGIGLADFTTRRLFEKIDYEAMNQNVLTSTFVERAKIPMVMENDREALEAAVRCNWGVEPEDTRFIRIPNTLHLRYAYLSENLIEHPEAVRLVLENTHRLPAEDVPLVEAQGLALAEDLEARFDSPPFDNSAVDGYALRSADAEAGRTFRVVDEAPAGRPAAKSVGEGEAIKIFTGGGIPEGADAGVVVEKTSGWGEG